MVNVLKDVDNQYVIALVNFKGNNMNLNDKLLAVEKELVKDMIESANLEAKRVFKARFPDLTDEGIEAKLIELREKSKNEFLFKVNKYDEACVNPELDFKLKRVLLLHLPDNTKKSFVCCTGCDYSGWESEPPEWPCRTVRLILDLEG